MNYLELSLRQQERARELLASCGIVDMLRTAGAEVHFVGAFAMGLMGPHRDVDMHVYTPRLDVEADFAVMGRFAAQPCVSSISFADLSATDEACLEWHAVLSDSGGDEWKFDIIHIERGSTYDGYFERMAEYIRSAVTPSLRERILRLKFETPADEYHSGVEYYRAVIEGDVQDLDSLRRFCAEHPSQGIDKWWERFATRD